MNRPDILKGAVVLPAAVATLGIQTSVEESRPMTATEVRERIGMVTGYRDPVTGDMWATDASHYIYLDGMWHKMERVNAVA